MILPFREVRSNSCLRSAFFAIFWKTCTKIFVIIVWPWFKVRWIDMILNNVLGAYGMLIWPLKKILDCFEVTTFTILKTMPYDGILVQNFYVIGLHHFSTKNCTTCNWLKKWSTTILNMIRSAFECLDTINQKNKISTSLDLIQYTFSRHLRTASGCSEDFP